MASTTLYHGTDAETAEAIRAVGRIAGPVYLTPRRDMAEQYGPVVLAVLVDTSALLVDLDLPGGRLLTAEDASAYLDGRVEPSIEAFLAAGYSVGTPDDVAV